MTGPARFELIADARPADAPWSVMSWPLRPGVRLRGETVEVRPAVPETDAAALHAALDADEVWRHVAGRPSSAEAWEAALREEAAPDRVPRVIRLVRPVGGLPAGAVAGTSSYLEVAPGDARLALVLPRDVALEFAAAPAPA